MPSLLKPVDIVNVSDIISRCSWFNYCILIEFVREDSIIVTETRFVFAGSGELELEPGEALSAII